MKIDIKFGTDGWRGIIAEDFTFANVRHCAQSMAEHLKETGTADNGLVIGYDTRYASDRFAVAVSEVIAANGIKTYLCSNATPTPVISFGVANRKAAGAVIITASHNPPEWNGFKIKAATGSSAPHEVESSIESRLPNIIRRGTTQRIPLDEGLANGLIQYIDLYPAYVEHINNLVDVKNIRKAGFKVAVDSMFGAGSGYLKSIISGGRTKIYEIHGEHNPLFPGLRPEPIPPHLSQLSEYIKENYAVVGFATDGDADRIGVVDEQGNPLNALQLFALLALYWLEVRKERGALIKTVATTNMIDKLGKLFDVPVYVTPVGFKHVAPKMMEENALIGGEESSGFGFRGHVPERDGILSALCFLDLMVSLNKTPSQLVEYLYKTVGPHYYKRTDLTFPPADRAYLIDRLSKAKPDDFTNKALIETGTADGFRFLMEDESWLLVRFSGTEPLLRIYAESESTTQTDDLLSQARKIMGV
ncbi:MAG: phosphoglucomutase/phosphomannomutase family protein [Chloroflexota bacterium]|nr:phosphoglucomutase/phosphomannomutase family protein [Chloroflexota bacterium]